MRRVTYHWKALDKGYNFALNLIALEGLHAKLWAPKVTRVPYVGISGLPLGSPETKCHLDVVPWRGALNLEKGRGGINPINH